MAGGRGTGRPHHVVSGHPPAVMGNVSVLTYMEKIVIYSFCDFCDKCRCFQVGVADWLILGRRGLAGCFNWMAVWIRTTGHHS